MAALGDARRVALADDLGPQLEPVRAALAAAGIAAVSYADAAGDREQLGALEATVTGLRRRGGRDRLDRDHGRWPAARRR